MAQVLPAASRDDTLPMLTAVCLDIRGESLTLAATDRYRLAVRELQWEPAIAGLRAIALVPARTLADAARTMAPGRAGAGGVHPGRRHRGRDPRPVEGMISFECRGRRLTGRLIGGEFIRYQSRFPDGYGCRAEVPAAPFIEAVRRVSLVADRASPVRLTFGQGQVVVEAQTEGRARAAEAVAASFEGDEPAIAFNPHYLLDGLTARRPPVCSPARPPAERRTAPPGRGRRRDQAGVHQPGQAGPDHPGRPGRPEEEDDGGPAPKKAAGQEGAGEEGGRQRRGGQAGRGGKQAGRRCGGPAKVSAKARPALPRKLGRPGRSAIWSCRSGLRRGPDLGFGPGQRARQALCRLFGQPGRRRGQRRLDRPGQRQRRLRGQLDRDPGGRPLAGSTKSMLSVCSAGACTGWSK